MTDRLLRRAWQRKHRKSWNKSPGHLESKRQQRAGRSKRKPRGE